MNSCDLRALLRMLEHRNNTVRSQAHQQAVGGNQHNQERGGNSVLLHLRCVIKLHREILSTVRHDPAAMSAIACLHARELSLTLGIIYLHMLIVLTSMRDDHRHRAVPDAVLGSRAEEEAVNRPPFVAAGQSSRYHLAEHLSTI